MRNGPELDPGREVADKASALLFRHGRACPGHLQAIDLVRSSAQGRGWRRWGRRFVSNQQY